MMENTDDDEIIAKLLEEELLFAELEEQNVFFQKKNEEQDNSNEEEQSIRLQREQLKEEQDRLYLESIEQDRLYLIKKNEKPIPPPEFICPISNNIIETPLRDEDGISYEKGVILKYLKENNGKNHLGKIIEKSKLIVDNVLKSEIGYWKREHPNWK